jgi:hypothetical protein
MRVTASLTTTWGKMEARISVASATLLPRAAPSARTLMSFPAFRPELDPVYFERSAQV